MDHGTTHGNDILGGRDISRRSLLRGSAVLGLGAVGASALAGCASDSGTPSAGATPSNAVAKRGGTLRYAMAGASPRSGMDAHFAADSVQAFNLHALYNPLAETAPDFSIHKVLAEEISHDGTGENWTVRLRDGLEFHNGKTVSAEDVIFTFQRILDPATAATCAGQLSMIKEMKKLDERTVRFEMHGPSGWFDIAISDGGPLGIVPVGYDPKNPIGTGPFKVASYNPGVLGVFDRNPNFFEEVMLDKLECPVINDDTARLNALMTGQVDASLSVSPVQVAQVEQASNLSLLRSATGRFLPITMRVDRGPLADVRLRQALRLCLDRKQVVEVAYGGFAEQASDVYGRYDPAFDTSLVRNQDLDQAKSLVKQAGADGMTLTLTTGNVGAGMVSQCQVLATNAAKIGLKIKVDVVDAATLFGENYLSWDFAVDVWPGQNYLTTSALADGPAASVNETHFKDEAYNALWNEAAGTLDGNKRADLIKQMQRIQFDRGGFIVTAFQDQLSASSTKVTGFVAGDHTGRGNERPLQRIGFV